MIRGILGNSVSLFIALVILFFLFWLLKKFIPGAATIERFAAPH